MSESGKKFLSERQSRLLGKSVLGKIKLNCWLFLFGLVFCCLGQNTAVAQELPEPETPVVHAILFFSPTCPHCHHVMMMVLPPLMDQYGDQLQIMGLDTSYEMGQHLYQTAVTQFQIPDDRLGVPTLIVGDVVLVGSLEIPELFPTLIEAGLADGGIDWPDIPALKEILLEMPPATAPSQPATEPEEANPLVTEDLALPTQAAAEPTAVASVATIASSQEPAVLSLDEMEAIDIDQAVGTVSVVPPADPVGFTLGWTVLLGLVAGLGYGVWAWLKQRPLAIGQWERANNNNKRTVFILGLVAMGLIVAGYLAYVETTNVTAVCGPVGECNIVQSSPYARIFGVPVALIGVLSYLAIGVLWLLQRPLDKKASGLPRYGLLALTLFGTIFSIYLTVLELLVIHAICAWCLTSAVVTLLLFLIVVKWLTKRPSHIISVKTGG